MMKDVPIIAKTSDGKILRVDWDVGLPDQTIKTMFVVSIRNPLDLFSKKQTVGCWNGSSWMEVSITDDGNGEKAVPLSNKKVTGPVFKKELIWNGSSWMEVDQPEPVFQKVEPEFKKASEEDEIANWNQLNEVEKKDILMSVDEIIPLIYNRNQKDYKKVTILQTKSVNDLMVKSVALQIQGYPIEEIRKIFKVEDPKWTLEELVELEELQKIKDENARRKELERLQKIRDEITRLMSQNPQWTFEELKELKKIKDENARCKELERLQKIRDEIVRLMSQRESSQRQGG